MWLVLCRVYQLCVLELGYRKAGNRTNLVRDSLGEQKRGGACGGSGGFSDPGPIEKSRQRMRLVTLVYFSIFSVI